MDPTEALECVRDIIRNGTNEHEAYDNFYLLADLVENLDEWVMRGGFLPVPWTMAQLRGPA